MEPQGVLRFLFGVLVSGLLTREVGATLCLQFCIVLQHQGFLRLRAWCLIAAERIAFPADGEKFSSGAQGSVIRGGK
jgi:hypothetical protein